MRTKTNAPEVVSLARRAFPDYKGRKFYIDIVSDEREFGLNSYWDSGSRTYYKFISLNGARTAEVPQNGTVFDGLDLESKIPAGCALVENCCFMGKWTGITVHIRQSDSVPHLTQEVA